MNNYDHVDVRKNTGGQWLKLSSEEVPETVKYAVRIQVMSEDVARGHVQVGDTLWLWKIG